MLPRVLTIIVPVFNEEESLPRFKEEMDKYLAKTAVPSLVLFINDGSTDKSLDIIKNICLSDHYQLASFDRNYGLSTAIKAGIDLCQTKYIGYIDADMQTSPEDFITYFDYLGDYQMVNGIRGKRSDTFVKKMSSKIANGFRRMMINDGIEDTCCPLKIMDSNYAKKMPFFNGMHRFMPALIQLQGGKVKQLPVRHFPRFAGTAKYHLFNRLVGPFFDTMAFRWMKRRYINYQVKDTGAAAKSIELPASEELHGR